jgi:hypothetical protein
MPGCRSALAYWDTPGDEISVWGERVLLRLDHGGWVCGDHEPASGPSASSPALTSLACEPTHHAERRRPAPARPSAPPPLSGGVNSRTAIRAVSGRHTARHPIGGLRTAARDTLSGSSTISALVWGRGYPARSSPAFISTELIENFKVGSGENPPPCALQPQCVEQLAQLDAVGVHLL